MQPKVLLLDEPLSALDKKLREQMQIELRRLQRAVGITFVLVTHDQEEALAMSDRVAVMFNGSIAQVDTPVGLYQRPVNRQVAGFIGVMNFLEAKITAIDSSTMSLDIATLGSVELPSSATRQYADCEPGPVTVGIRPEMITILYDSAVSAERVFSAEIVNTAYYGDMTFYDLCIEDTDVIIAVSMRNTTGRPILTAGTKTRAAWSPESLVLLEA